MAVKAFPWMRVYGVPWSEDDAGVLCRGYVDGLPVLSYGIAPRDRLATRRQLRSMGLRPGGADPVAVLYVRHRASGTRMFADLYLVERARAVRPMTPARWRAVRAALAARCTCRVCGEVAWVELPRAHRTCEGCLVEVEVLDPASWVHDYLEGAPTLSAAEHAELDGARVAPVIPLQRTGRERAVLEGVRAG